MTDRSKSLQPLIQGEPMIGQARSKPILARSLAIQRVRLALLSGLMVTIAACGGGGGGGAAVGSTTTAGATPAGGTTAAGTTTTTTTPALTDAQANAQAVANMGSTPVNVAVWSQLNSAGADSARSMVPGADTVVVSTFKTITDPTGGPGLIKVFDAVVARGTLNGSRVFQLTSGALPAGGTLVWVNVSGEDFTKNNPGAESALEITVTALGSALATPMP